MIKKAVKIKDIANIQSGYAFKSSMFNDSKGLPIIRIRNVTSQRIDTFYNGDYSDEYIVDTGDLLVSMDGEFKIIKWKKGKGLLNQRVCRIHIKNEEVILKDYLLYFLPRELKDIEDKTPFVTVKHLSVKDINNIEVNLPPLETQKKIVEVLDKAQALIDTRKEQIKLLDYLIQSVFYDMFGDPVTNPKGWKLTKVIEECDCMVPGRDKPKSFTGDIPWITINDLNSNGYTMKSKMGFGLREEEIKEVGRKKVPKMSVLMSCVGDLGITSINGMPVVINQQLHSFQCGPRVNPQYLRFYIPTQKGYMSKMATSTTVSYLNKGKCNNIPLLLPPIELQNQFAEMVEKIESQKQLTEKSLEEMKNNYNGLMRKAFKGELFS